MGRKMDGVAGETGRKRGFKRMEARLSRGISARAQGCVTSFDGMIPNMRDATGAALRT